MVHLIFTIQINTPPTVKTFLSSYADKTTSTYCVFLIVYPFGKTHLKFIIPHLSIIKRKMFFSHSIFGHRTYPKIFLSLLPWTPKRLVHGGTSCHTERNAHTIHIKNILIGFKHAVYIVDSHLILYLIIHVKHT